MAAWRSNAKWTPLMVASLAAVATLGALGALTAPVGLGIAAVTAVVIARW